MPPPATLSSTRTALLAFAGYLAVTLAMTWPLATALTTTVPADLGDPLLNTWILWWNTLHWPLSAGWWNAGIFFPASGALAFSEHLLGLAPFAAPIAGLTGSPLAAYNVVFILTFALSATTMFLLVRDLTGRRDAAFVAGLAFGFAPYRIAQLSHVQVLAAFWMPVALLGLHRFAATRRRRWLAMFATAVAWQALTNGYYLMFLTVLIGLWLVWFARRLGPKHSGAVALAFVVAAAALLPILLPFRSIHEHYGLTRNLEQMRLYSSDLAGLTSASPSLWLWGHLPSYGTSEGALFTGVTVLVLLAAGLIARNQFAVGASAMRSRSDLTFYVTASAILYLLALGPAPSAFGQRLDIAGPFAWLAVLPGFESLRAPARFGMLVSMCVAIGAGIGFARLTASWYPRFARVLLLVVCIAVTAEGWPRAIPLWDPPKAWDLRASEGAGGLLVLPILNEFNEAASMFRAMSHGRPLVNGYSGHIPPWYLPLREALNEFDPRVLDALAGAGVTQVALVTRSDPEQAWRKFVLTRSTVARESATGFALFDLAAPRTAVDPGGLVPIAAVHASLHPEIAHALTDNRPDTWWSTLGPQAGGEDLIVDLGTIQNVGAVEVQLGRSSFDFPRVLQADLSADGTVWTRAWGGPTAGLAVGALMRDPVRGPIRLVFDAAPARFLRLRQTGQHRTAHWTVAELRVFGPGAGAGSAPARY